jgi:hypothetical protein
MKKGIVILTLFIAVLNANGQNARVAVNFGPTISDISGNENLQNNATKTGFTVGIGVDAPIGSHFSFNPSVNYRQKGNLLQENANVKVNNALRYAEMPLTFLYHVSGNKAGGFYFGVGPYASFNVPSKRTTEIKKTGKKSYTDITFGATLENDFKGVDYGVNGVAGWKFGKVFTFNAFYDYGIRNISPREGGEMNNRSFGVQFGFFFNN